MNGCLVFLIEVKINGSKLVTFYPSGSQILENLESLLKQIAGL